MPEVHITRDVWQFLLRLKKHGRNAGIIAARLRKELAELPTDRLYPTRSGLFALTIGDLTFRIRKMEGRDVYHVIHVAPRF